ncbi:MAG TPA: ATP-binding protein, partial [Bacteroidales bacterium]
QEMILSVIRDVTERKKSEQSLREHAKMLEHAPVLVRNLNDEIIIWNNGMEKIYGFRDEETVGKVYRELLQTQYPQPLEEIFGQLYDQGKWEGELQHKGKDGQIVLVLSSWILYKDEHNDPIAIIEVDKDITKRKKAEKELKESEEKLKLALENGSIGVWVWDIATNDIEWDERMERMFGVEPGSFGKTYDAFEVFLVEEDVPHTRNAIKKALEEDVHFETVYRIKSKDGDIKHISAKALVTKDSKGKPVKMTGVCFDITAMKKDTEQVLFSLNEELLRSNKELEQFAYVASHDLQEPLRMVSSFTQLLAQRYKNKLDQDAKDFIQFAVDGASRMQTLINDLLAFSRIQTRGKEFSDVDMHEVLAKVMYNLNVKIQEKNALVTIDELPVVFADEGQMVQLFQNLVGNAIKFSAGTPVVHISSQEENDHFIFSVKDNGIGIEKQYFERIFQIFQRLQPKDEYEGTGIGLAICKRVVERHGGRIWVESELDKGTTFYFTIRKPIINK